MEPRTVTIAWGGYYSQRAGKNGGYSIWRLLDFNVDAVHKALWMGEPREFDHAPTLEEALESTQGKHPTHVPIAAASLILAEELEFLGSRPITGSDLEGYRLYLEHFEVEATKIDQILDRIEVFSQREPLVLRLEADGDDGRVRLAE